MRSFEMRIRYWISYVASSYLIEQVLAVDVLSLHVLVPLFPDRHRADLAEFVELRLRIDDPLQAVLVEDRVPLVVRGLVGRDEVGIGLRLRLRENLLELVRQGLERGQAVQRRTVVRPRRHVEGVP